MIAGVVGGVEVGGGRLGREAREGVVSLHWEQPFILMIIDAMYMNGSYILQQLFDTRLCDSTVFTDRPG